jgi:hypothetical protein
VTPKAYRHWFPAYGNARNGASRRPDELSADDADPEWFFSLSPRERVRVRANEMDHASSEWLMAAYAATFIALTSLLSRGERKPILFFFVWICVICVICG